MQASKHVQIYAVLSYSDRLYLIAVFTVATVLNYISPSFKLLPELLSIFLKISIALTFPSDWMFDFDSLFLPKVAKPESEAGFPPGVSPGVVPRALKFDVLALGLWVFFPFSGDEGASEAGPVT